MFDRSMNKVILIGNVGKEVTFHNTTSPVSKFSVATTESIKNKTTGSYEPKTEWHNVVVFGKLAEMVAQYIKKGEKVLVEGKNQTTKWVAQDGIERFKTEVVVTDIQQLSQPSQTHRQTASIPQQPQQPQQQWGNQPPQSQQQWGNQPPQSQQQWDNQPPQSQQQPQQQLVNPDSHRYQKPPLSPSSNQAPNHKQQSTRPAYQPSDKS